jgi:hypothetical protein
MTFFQISNKQPIRIEPEQIFDNEVARIIDKDQENSLQNCLMEILFNATRTSY